VHPGDTLGIACIEVFIPVDVWERTSCWRPSPAAVVLLNALVPLDASRHFSGNSQNGSQQHQRVTAQDQQLGKANSAVPQQKEHQASGGIGLTDQGTWSQWRQTITLIEELRCKPAAQMAFR